MHGPPHPAWALRDGALVGADATLSTADSSGVAATQLVEMSFACSSDAPGRLCTKQGLAADLGA